LIVSFKKVINMTNHIFRMTQEVTFCLAWFDQVSSIAIL